MLKTSKLDIIVYVEPAMYCNMPYKDKNYVAILIVLINWYYRDKNKHLLITV